MCTPTFFVTWTKNEWISRNCKQKCEIHKIMLNTARKNNNNNALDKLRYSNGMVRSERIN